MHTPVRPAVVRANQSVERGAGTQPTPNSAAVTLLRQVLRQVLRQCSIRHPSQPQAAQTFLPRTGLSTPRLRLSPQIRGYRLAPRFRRARRRGLRRQSHGRRTHQCSEADTASPAARSPRVSTRTTRATPAARLVSRPLGPRAGTDSTRPRSAACQPLPQRSPPSARGTRPASTRCTPANSAARRAWQRMAPTAGTPRTRRTGAA